MAKKRTPEENKAYCEKYPFLKWYGDPLYMGYSEDEINYDYTWEDEIPEGWRKAFCPQMWDELKEILAKANYIDEFRFMQIKEKWGVLTMYYSSLPEDIFEEVLDWEQKYEELSEKVCINCGKPATRMTLGWITFICDDCVEKDSNKSIPVEDIEEFYNDTEAYRKKHFNK